MAVAIDPGFFEKRGINAEIVSLANGNLGLDLVATGDADLGTSTEAGGVVRRSKGAPLYVLGMGALSGLNNSIVASEDIQSPEDLEGKKIGFPAGSSANYFFHRYVQKHGLDASAITAVNADPPELTAALNRGDIDGFFLWDPWPDQAVETIPGMHILARSGDDDVYFAQQYFYGGERMINDQPLASATLDAIIEGNTWLSDEANLPQAAEILAGYYEMEPENALRLLKLWNWGTVAFSPQTRENIIGAQEFLIEAGQIEQMLPDADLNDYLRPDAMKAIHPELVTGF
jgi:NitT/TauT family transport system substrate-binding protein